jgi:leucyl aminopeptidase (aminopeptidase T)
MGNLPGGEVFTTPGEVNGVFVIDGVGDYLCEKYGNLKHSPLTVWIEEPPRPRGVSESNCATTSGPTATRTRSDRVGEFAIGTNIQLEKVIGEILQDEKFPGIHIAFGNPYGAHTGADWYSKTHIDVVGTEFDIIVDGTPLMKAGKFLI